MKCHQDVVLQQRVWPRPIKARNWNVSPKWICRSQHQAKEKHAHREHRDQRPGHERIIESLAELVRHHDQIASEYESPQQNRTL